MAIAAGPLAPAAELRCVGVLGNSGQFGPSLVRISPTVEENGRPTGVFVDRDDTIWFGAGNAVLRLSLDGRLLQRHPLEPAGSGVEAFHFAALGQTLYFAGRGPKGKTVFALPMQEPDRPAAPLAANMPEGNLDTLRLAAEPLDAGKLLLGLVLRDGKRIAVFSLDPISGRLTERCTVPGRDLQGIAWNAAEGVLYLGGLLRGETLEGGILACNLQGQPRDASFPAATVPTPAQPTSFRGRVSLAAGALWDSGHYGYLARVNARCRGAPGIVCRWRHAIDEVTQVVSPWDRSGRFTPLVLATSTGEACWMASFDPRENRFDLLRRMGALPVIGSVGISPDGWVTVGTAQSQLWWRWEDGPNAAPAMADLSVACTPGTFSGGAFCALGPVYGTHELKRSSPVPLVFEPRVFDRNSARRPGHAQPVPMKQPVGLAVFRGKRRLLLVCDAETKQLWQAELSLPDFTPRQEAWKPVEVDGVAWAAPTDLAVLDDGSLLVADAGRIVRLAADGERWRAAWFWPDADHRDQLGDRLRLAADGPYALVSDASRHRVLWLDWRSRVVVAQFGRSDQPGDGLDRLDTPAQVALSGRRAVVADAGNQRVLKLVLDPGP